MNEQLPSRLCVSLRRGCGASFAAIRRPMLMIMYVCLGCGTPPDEGVECPAIEVSAVADAPSDSTRPVSLSNGTTIQLNRAPLVTSADVTGARRVPALLN